MRYLFSTFAGAIVAWSFYPNYWWAAILGMAILLGSLDSQPRRNRFKMTALFALTYFGFHVQWVSALGNDAWLALILICGLPWLIFGLLNIDSKSNWFFFQPAALVVVLEVIRANWPWGGLPWGLLAYSQLDGPLVKLSMLGGQAIVSGVVVICAAAMIKLVKQRSLTAVLLIAICMLTARSVDVFHSSETVTLSAVQGNVPRVGNTLSAQRAAVLNNHVAGTEKLLSDIKLGVTPSPDLIVWPESGTDLDPLIPGIAADEINRLSASTEIPLLIGGTTFSGGTLSNGEDLTAVGPRNVGILWSAESGPGEMYVKRHPLPFGEYLPMRDFLARYIKRFDQIPNDFVAGNKVGVFNVGDKKIGDVICFEIANANLVFDTVAAGAQVMVVQTNNSTFGNSTQPSQQFAITRFRAIESQRAFLVASTSGISGLIRNDGEVLMKTKQFESAVVTGEVELISEKTIVNRYPHWVLIVSVLILIFCYRSSRGKKS
jgi:apolipoprotein N-acyltransferase